MSYGRNDGARSRTRTWEMSVCGTDALAAWRSEQLLVHPGGLEPPCLAAAASEAAASAVSPRVPVWCWLEDSNLPPLAYEASALPDELSQLCKLTKGSRRRPRSGGDLVLRRGSAPRPNLDVHNVKERGANRRRSHRRMGSCDEGVRAHAHTLSGHELSMNVLRLVLRAICPPASAAEGDPAPVIPVSASSFARSHSSSWGRPNSRARP